MKKWLKVLLNEREKRGIKTPLTVIQFKPDGIIEQKFKSRRKKK